MWVVSCEHARRDVPPGLDLGLDAAALSGHLAWDPGAVEVAQELALALGAPLVAAAVSRLVVDTNRRAGWPDTVPARAFGVDIPGNAGLEPAAVERRLAAFHAPYRRWLHAEVARAVAQGGCLHLSVHSFTPVLGAQRRTLDVGVLYDPSRSGEARVAAALLASLRAEGFDARPDEPYLGVDEGCTTWLREQFPDAAYAGLELELSQRLDAADRRRVCAAVRAAL